MDNGFILIHRNILNWGWFSDANTFRVFLYLLLKANWQDSEWRGIKIKRGQLITGRNSVAQDTGISKQSVRTSLNNLKSTNEITIQSTNKFSVVTIVKYNDYQQLNKKSTNKPTNKLTNEQPTTNQQPTTDKEEEYKEEEKQKQFDFFRVRYGGTKRGNKTEFENFRKKHKDWQDVLPLLLPAVENQIRERTLKKSNEFMPQWKNLQTWINQRCWEEEVEIKLENPVTKEKIHTALEIYNKWEKRRAETIDGYVPEYKTSL